MRSPHEITHHLDGRDMNYLQDAATTADDFALTHKLSINNTGGPNKYNQSHKGNSNRPYQNIVKTLSMYIVGTVILIP